VQEKPRKSSKALPIALIALLALAGIAVLVWFLLPKGSTSTTPTAVPTATSVAADQPTAQAIDTETPRGSSGDAQVSEYQMGTSVQGNSLTYTCIENGKDKSLNITGGINGTHANTKTLLESFIKELSAPGQVPSGTTVCILPVLNPDGLATNSPYNANGVDLTRNWLTPNWQADITDANGPKAGGGGSTFFSEPETNSYKGWLRDLESVSKNLVVINYYASTSGQVIPSYRVTDGQPQIFGDAATVAQKFAGALGYTYTTSWTDQPITGELTNWCGEEYISCIDVHLPKTEKLSSEEVQQQITAIKGLLP